MQNTEPTQEFDGNGNMTTWRRGDYEIIIERGSDGKVAFWTDSHGSCGDASDLPVPDESLIVIDFLPREPVIVDCPPLVFSEPELPVYDAQQLLASQPASVQWCLDPSVTRQGDVPEAECPDCSMPLSECACL